MLNPSREEKRKIIGSATVKEARVNVRKNPSTQAEILMEVKKGDKFNVTEGGTKDFTAVIIDDKVAYIMTSLLEITK